jgi:hypothetical protein
VAKTETRNKAANIDDVDRDIAKEGKREGKKGKGKTTGRDLKRGYDIGQAIRSAKWIHRGGSNGQVEKY